jgi:hypothetical protein
MTGSVALSTMERTGGNTGHRLQDRRIVVIPIVGAETVPATPKLLAEPLGAVRPDQNCPLNCQPGKTFLDLTAPARVVTEQLVQFQQSRLVGIVRIA